jgi:hypothetical protein
VNAVYWGSVRLAVTLFTVQVGAILAFAEWMKRQDQAQKSR